MAGRTARWRTAEAIITLAAADSNVPHALRLHYNVSALWRVLPADEHVRQQFGRILAGKLFGGASTEQGTPKPGLITTRLTRQDGHYRLNGRKYYSTGTLYADYAYIAAIDEQDQPVTVILPLDRPGLEIVDDWDGFGQRLTASGSLLLHDARVEESELQRVSLRELGLPSHHISAWRQLVLVATAAGIVRALVRETQDYVRSKGRAALHSGADAARDDPFIQQAIGDIAAHSMPSTRWCATRPASWSAARKPSGGARPTPRPSCCRADWPRPRRSSSSASSRCTPASSVRGGRRVGHLVRLAAGSALAQPAHDLQPQPAEPQGARAGRLSPERHDHRVRAGTGVLNGRETAQAMRRSRG